LKGFGSGDNEIFSICDIIESILGGFGVGESKSDGDVGGWWSVMVDILFSDVEI
jgi:hypothetical protein